MGYFVGIQAPNDIDRAVEAMRGAVPDCDQEKLIGLRDQSHITIAHLGKQMPDVEGFQQIAECSMPFEVTFQGLSIFRNQNTTHLVIPVVGEAVGKLRVLHARMAKFSRSHGRTYNPHMTIATVPSDKAGESQSYRRMLALREKYRKQVWGQMVVCSFQLFSSTQGVVRVVDRWQLTAKEEVM
jgi:2'-5' RNA ligase